MSSFYQFILTWIKDSMPDMSQDTRSGGDHSVHQVFSMITADPCWPSFLCTSSPNTSNPQSIKYSSISTQYIQWSSLCHLQRRGVPETSVYLNFTWPAWRSDVPLLVTLPQWKHLNNYRRLLEILSVWIRSPLVLLKCKDTAGAERHWRWLAVRRMLPPLEMLAVNVESQVIDKET